MRKGYVEFLNNWFTSPSLCQYLHENDTGTCGTVRENSKYMPELPVGQRVGDCVRKKCENVLTVKWKDKRRGIALSTLHEGQMKDSVKMNSRGDVVMKPDIIVDHNTNLRLIGKSIVMIGGVECVRKTSNGTVQETVFPPG